MWNEGMDDEGFSVDGWLRLLAEMPGEMGHVLKKRREGLGMSQRELADRVNELQSADVWHQTTVAKTEAGTRPLKWREAWPLAMALECADVTGLLGFHSDPLSLAVYRRWLDTDDGRQASIRKRVRGDLGAIGADCLQRFEEALEAWERRLDEWRDAYRSPSLSDEELAVISRGRPHPAPDADPVEELAFLIASNNTDAFRMADLLQQLRSEE